MSFMSIKSTKMKNPTYYWFIVSGIMAALVNSFYGPFTVKYLERLGGNEFHITMLSSLPGIIGVVVSLPGALWIIVNIKKNLKTVTVDLILISRLFVVTLIPLIWITPKWAPLFCVILIALKSIPESMSLTAFQGLTGDLFDVEQRSTAISQRSRFSVPASLAVTLLSGLVLRFIPGNDTARLTIYQIFFIFAAIFGIFEALFLGKMKHVETVERRDLTPSREILRQVLENKPYKKYVLSSLVFYFTWQMGWPIFNIYQVITLKADELWLSAIVVVSSIGMFIGYRFWNYIIRKYGNGKTAVWVTLGMSLNPVLMVFFPNLYWITGINLLIGFFTAGTMTVLLNALLEVTPQLYRVVYVGTYNTLVNASLAISPFVSFAILKWTGMIPALLIVFACRLAGCLVFWFYDRSQKEIMRS